MARLTVPVASLIQGVSQQADPIRLPGQCQLMDNAWVSPTDGLTQRHPIDHITKIDAADLGDVLVHTINRSADERYITLFGGDPGSEFVRVFETDGTEVPVFGPLSLGAPYTPDFSYLQSVSPFRPAYRYLKALTLVDYTLVLNRNIGVELETVVTDSDPSETVGFLFVKAGQYSTKYSATVTLGNEDPVEFAVTTWDGITRGDGSSAEWELNITAPGNIGSTWVVGAITHTATYTVQLGDDATDVAIALTAAIDALDEVSATRVGTVITIASERAGRRFTPGVTAATTGTFTLTPTVDGQPSNELASIETNDIAVALADQINADARLAATVSGSVVRIDTATVTVPNNVWRLNITKKSATGTIWTVNVLSQVATFTVTTPTAIAIATGLTSAINALTGITASRAGTVITMEDTTVGQNMSPIVTPGTGGTYTLEELAHAGSSQYTIDAIKAEDSRGNGAILAIHHSVDHIDDLPLVMSDGFSIKITNGTPEPQDDLYVMFSADVPGDFGKGRWIETTGFNIPDRFDPETMPHALIRRQDDMTGTVTGTPLAKYFEFGPIDWAVRTVGDEDTAPHPSIAKIAIADSLEGAPVPIQDVFFFRNRLGFIQNQKVVMSESGVYFNFWRTTTQDVLDGDPIDILVPHHTAINLAHAVAYNRTLLLLSERVNFLLDGEPLLTPASVQVSPILEYEHDPLVDPITVAQGIYFPTQRGEFSGVRQMVPDPTVDRQFRVEDVGIAVPQYIEGRGIQFATNELEGTLVTLANGDQSALYVLKTSVVGQAVVQIAWGRFRLGDNARIMGVGFIGSTLYLVVSRPDGTHLESSEMVSGRVDAGALYLTHLDRRVSVDSGTYDGMADRTTWTLNYEPDADEEYVAVTRSPNGNDGGMVIPLTLDGGNVVSAAGDYSTDLLWIGQTFEWRFRFSKVFLRTGDAQTGKQRVQSNGRLQVLHGIVHVKNTARFDVDVTPYLRSELSVTYTSATARHVISGNLPLMSEAVRFGVYSEDPQIDLSSSSPLPVNVMDAAFEVQYETVAFNPFGG